MTVEVKPLKHDCSWRGCKLVRNFEVLHNKRKVGEYCGIHAEVKAERLRAQDRKAKAKTKAHTNVTVRRKR